MTTRRIITLIIGSALSFATHGAMAGAFVGADANNPNLIVHPSNYTGSGGNVTVRVCISPGSDDIGQLIVPVQNVINTMNAQQPTTGNLIFGGANDIPGSAVDAESALLHEVGHCIGLAHPNLATESGLPAAQRDYTKTTTGNNGVYNLNAGVDGALGSQDDLRGDDLNLHWFRTLNNNPFTIAGVVDSSTYSRNIAQLPGGSFVANAGRDVALLLGVPNTEASMQQGQFFDEAQRTLGHDDVATLAYGASGVDEVAGTADDYTFTLEYQGVTSSGCDVTVSVDNQTGFASCSLGFTFVGGGDHFRISSGTVRLNNATNWYYNQTSNAPPDNIAPVLDPIADQSVIENDSVFVPLSASDDNPGDTLELQEIGAPGFCQLNDNADGTGDLTCTPQDGDAGLYPVTIFVIDNGNPIANDSQTFSIEVIADNAVAVTACSQPDLAIPDGDPVGVTDVLTVTDAGTITDVGLLLSATHTYVGDLTFTLEKLGGPSAVAVDRPGFPASTFGCDQADIGVIIDDEGTDGSAEEACSPTPPALSGTLTPAEPLSIFDGGTSAGTWQMTVSDSADQDTGVLNEWCVNLRIVPDPDVDTDGDGVFDNDDNCVDVTNANQIDADGDGYGNLCDADLDNDCVTNPVDLGIFRSAFFGSDPVADLNSDGVVNPIDLGIFRSLFFQPPGPSGLTDACSN